MAIIFLMKNSTYWQGYEKLRTLALLVGMQNGAVAMENSLTVPQKAKHTITIWCTNFIPRHTRKRIENRDSNILVCQYSLQHYSHEPKDGNNTSFINRLMDKQNVIHTCNGILFSLKKE